MKVAVFSAKPYDRRFLDEANRGRFELVYFESRLDLSTVSLADGFPVVCTFVNDRLDRDVIRILFSGGTRMLALRCSGYNNVDLYSVARLGIVVARVPAYSPNSISEYTLGLMLALARKICKAYNRTREGNFALTGLLGFNLCDRLCGVIGTGRIGAEVVKGLRGLGCEVRASDVIENPELLELGVRYVSRDEIIETCDVISLHCPLTPKTRHLIDDRAVERMRDGVMLVNTSRGALIDAAAVVEGLKSGKIGSLAIDVYEEEGDLFFEDYSDKIIQDDVLARILNFPNVILTGHQAFFTVEAVRKIAEMTIDNILAWQEGRVPVGRLAVEDAAILPKSTGGTVCAKIKEV